MMSIEEMGENWKVLKDGENTIGYVQTKESKTIIYDSEFDPLQVLDNRQTINYSVLSAINNETPSELEMIIKYAYSLGVIDGLVMDKKEQEEALIFVERHANIKTKQMF